LKLAYFVAANLANALRRRHQPLAIFPEQHRRGRVGVFSNLDLRRAAVAAACPDSVW
jgi:hypothetical protein